MEKLLFWLLLKKEMNKLFKFYWKKEKQMLIFQIWFFCWLFLFFLFFFFQFLIFLFFFECKGWNNSSLDCFSKWRWTNCSTFIGKRKTKCWSSKSGSFVDCFLFSFFFFQFLIFLFFFECKEWNNSSLDCFSKRTWTNCSNYIGKRKTKCWSSKSGSFVDCFFFFFFFFSVSHFSIFFWM